MKKLLITTSLLTGMMVFAGGFRVSLQGVKQLAMAHTSAHAEDASVTFFNPAGMSFIPAKLSVVAGGFGAKSSVTYQNLASNYSHESNNPIGTPLYAAVAYKITDAVSLGLSVTTPFGSTMEWGKAWAGQEIVQRMQLQSFFYQPMVSVKLAPWASVGLSYIHATGMVDWDKAVTQFGGDMNINDEKAKGSGFGLGFYFKPDEKLDISIAYRSPVDMKAENGVVTFNVPKSLFSQIGLDENGQDGFTAKLPLVEEYTLGATYRITDKWLVSADYNYTGWDRYDQLTLDFENAAVGNHASDPTKLTNPKNFKNTSTIRVGTEYKITDVFAGRLGWYFDEAPYEDQNFIPETPSFDAHVLTAGLGINATKSFGVDLAIAKSFPKHRTFYNPLIAFGGQAKASTLYFGLGLRYNLY